MKAIAAIGALLICAAVPGAELHPIVKVGSGFLFGATADCRSLAERDSYMLVFLRLEQNESFRTLLERVEVF